jgi:hypothetical protein
MSRRGVGYRRPMAAGRRGGRFWGALLGCLPLVATAEPRVVGWLERVLLPAANVDLPAKLDTGARTSALDAEAIETFERDGTAWARFRLRGRRGAAGASLEAPVVGRTRVRSSLGRQERLVVALEACLAGERRSVHFTLSPRRGMIYPVLLGRRALEGWLAVDPARRWTTATGCGPGP